MQSDLRHAVRLLLKNPAFSGVAIVTLALGLGLNVSIFSIVNVLLFKPPDLPRAKELVWITAVSPAAARASTNLSHPDIVDLAASEVVSGVAAFADARMAVRAGDRTVRVSGQIVSGTYFDTLGLPPSAGRLLTADDETGPAAAVIGAGLRRRLFAGVDPVGQGIEINGQPFTVVGVAAEGFAGPDVLSPADLWVPVSMAEAIGATERAHDRDVPWLRAIVRLAPGVPHSRAEAALRGLAAAIAQGFPATHQDFSVAIDAVGGTNPGDRAQLAPLSLLPAVPLCVLLIACANVAGLLLARGVGRAREIAVRVALGASRARLVRQLLAESAVLAAAGGAASLLLSMWAPELLLRLAGAPLEADFAPDARVVAFAVVVSLVTALAFGLVPALRASREDGATALRGEPGTATLARTPRLLRVLVGGQLAVSLVLLMAAGLFVQSVATAGRTSVGFAVEERVTLSIDLRMQRYSDERARAFYQAALARIAAAPGTRSATMAAFVPLGGRVMFMPFYLPGSGADAADRPPTTAVNMVGPAFFETMALPIRRGRAIGAADQTPTPRAAVVNEAMAARLGHCGDAIGCQLRLGEPSAPPVEVVGIAADALVDEYGEASTPMVYLPHDGRAGEVTFLAWTAAPPGEALAELGRQIRSLDPSIAVFEPAALRQHVAGRMDAERGLSRLLALAGMLALGLAAFGLYGTIAYTVSRRTREIGLRLALGARPADVLRVFLGEGLRLTLIGLAAGLVPAAGLTLLLSRMLFGIHPGEPRAVAAASGLLLAAALAASYVPARRALAVDPAIALRSE